MTGNKRPERNDWKGNFQSSSNYIQWIRTNRNLSLALNIMTVNLPTRVEASGRLRSNPFFISSLWMLANRSNLVLGGYFMAVLCRPRTHLSCQSNFFFHVFAANFQSVNNSVVLSCAGSNYVNRREDKHWNRFHLSYSTAWFTTPGCWFIRLFFRSISNVLASEPIGERFSSMQRVLKLKQWKSGARHLLITFFFPFLIVSAAELIQR